MSFLKNWKTTLGGVATLALIAMQAHNDPSVLTHPGTLAQLAAGIGLIVAHDAAPSK